MDDGVEALAGFLVGEDEPAEHGPVDDAVAHEAGAELPHHGLEAWCPGLVDRVRRLIGVDHRRAQLAQDLGHGRLAGPDAAGQPDQLQWRGSWATTSNATAS